MTKSDTIPNCAFCGEAAPVWYLVNFRIACESCFGNAEKLACKESRQNIKIGNMENENA